MASVRILLMPREMRGTFFLIPKEIENFKIDRHLILPPMSVHPTDKGEDLAEEMFDLTNNPSRQEERLERYGNGPSLSSGDVVRTEDGDFLCCSYGWKKL